MQNKLLQNIASKIRVSMFKIYFNFCGRDSSVGTATIQRTQWTMNQP
jgi:hypothetical protein